MCVTMGVKILIETLILSTANGPKYVTYGTNKASAGNSD